MTPNRNSSAIFNARGLHATMTNPNSAISNAWGLLALAANHKSSAASNERELLV